MAKKNVRFVAIKTVKKPATVTFRTRSGETVSFKALKTFKKEEVVRFRAKSYVLRPPFAQERLRLRSDGRVALELKTAWRDGVRRVTGGWIPITDRTG